MGSIVIENVFGFPVQPLLVDATVNIPVVVAVTVGAVYPAILAEPLAPTPMAVLLLAQLNVAPAEGVTVKLVAATDDPEHTV